MSTSAEAKGDSRLRGYAVLDDAALLRFKPAVLRALAAINARSGGRYSPDTVFESLREQLRRPFFFALWLALDEGLLAKHKPADAVVAMLTINLVPDEVGTPVAYLSRAWIAPGYNGRPFDMALPLIERWAKERGAAVLLVTTERSSASCRPDAPWDRKAEAARLKGLLAYSRWMARRGFRMRETAFEKRLVS